MTKKKTLNIKELQVVLEQMGFANYEEYLDSPLWQEIRSKKIRGKAKCGNCGSQENLQVYHNVYTEATLKGTSQYGLVALCEECPHSEHLEKKNERLVAGKGKRRARWGRWHRGGKKKKQNWTTARKGRRTISRKF
jgi:hypothetical protein